MILLHVGHGPHVQRAGRIFRRFGPPDLHQRVVSHGWCGAEGLNPDVVVVHNCTDYGDSVIRARTRAGRVVGWVWNDRWEHPPLDIFERCDFLLGDVLSRAAAHVPAEKWHGHLPLVETEVFYPPPAGAERDIPVLVARGWTGHEAYWSHETRQALAGMEGVVWVDGERTPGEMADLYRRSRCVVALREDAGPSYTVVEAALCGAVPVVSDCPQMRKHFDCDLDESDGEELTQDWARFAGRYPEGIRRAVNEAVLGPSPQLTARNLAYFANWTAEAQGPELVRKVLG